MPIGTAPMTFFCILAAVIWLFSGNALRRGKICLPHSWSWPVILLIILPWVGLLYSPDTTGLGLDYAQKTHYWIYGFAVAAIPFKRFPSKHLVQAFIVGLAVISVAAIIKVGIILMQGGAVGNDSGLGPSYNTMSAYLVLGIMGTAFYFNEIKDSRKRFYICLLMLLFFIHLIILKGRNGYFTFFAVSPLIIVHMVKRLNLIKIFLIYGLIASLMAFSPSVRDQVSWTIRQINEHITAPPDIAWGKGYTANEHRFLLFRDALQAFKQHPLFGVGTGGFQTFVKQNNKTDMPLMAHPHNNYLQMAVSYGIIGILALTWLFWELFKNSWNRRKTVTGYFVFSSAIVIFVSGIFNSQILDTGSAVLLALTVGLQEEFPRFSNLSERL